MRNIINPTSSINANKLPTSIFWFRSAGLLSVLDSLYRRTLSSRSRCTRRHHGETLPDSGLFSLDERSIDVMDCDSKSFPPLLADLVCDLSSSTCSSAYGPTNSGILSSLPWKLWRWGNVGDDGRLRDRYGHGIVLRLSLTSYCQRRGSVSRTCIFFLCSFILMDGSR